MPEKLTLPLLFVLQDEAGAMVQEPIQVDPPSTDYGLERTVESEETERHDYVYASGQLLREVITTTDEDGNVTTQTLDFTYDASGSPYTLTRTVGTTSSTYYYVVNLQGDVMRLVSANGATVVEYWYDPWGRVLTASGTMAETNPLRYRGYYYDAETEFYYLQSRYYDPVICRFVNADGYASTGQGFLGQNMFAYCGNSPSNNIDTLGYAAQNATAVYCDGGSGLSSTELLILQKIQELDPSMNDFDPLSYDSCRISAYGITVDVCGVVRAIVGSDGWLVPAAIDAGVGGVAAWLVPATGIYGVLVGFCASAVSQGIREVGKGVAYAGIPELPNGTYDVYSLDVVVNQTEYTHGANGKQMVLEYHHVTTWYTLVSGNDDFLGYTPAPQKSSYVIEYALP